MINAFEMHFDIDFLSKHSLSRLAQLIDLELNTASIVYRDQICYLSLIMIF